MPSPYKMAQSCLEDQIRKEEEVLYKPYKLEIVGATELLVVF